MIHASLQHSERYEGLHPLFKQLFDYLKQHDLTAVPTGRITLCGEDLFINVVDATLVPAEAQKLEVHRAYIDVHFPLSDAETIGWHALERLTAEADAPFDAENDYAVYTAPAATYAMVQPGDFVIVYPEDAHAPAIGSGTLRKAIAKVRI